MKNIENHFTAKQIVGHCFKNFTKTTNYTFGTLIEKS